MIKSIVFDMDGTLLDSSAAMTYSVNYVRSSYGLDAIKKEDLENYINEPNSNIPKMLYNIDSYTKEHKDRFAKHYLENANLYVEPYAGVHELLKALHVDGFTLSIATNANDIFAYNMLEGQGLLEYFSFVVGANNVEKSKPNPEMIHHISKVSNIPLGQTVLVGDSIKDEGAALNAGIDFLFVDWGYGKSSKYTKSFSQTKELYNYITSY